MRKAVIKALTKPMTPSELRDRVTQIYKSVSLNNISDEIRLLKKKEIIWCHTPEQRYARIYELTRKGYTIQEEWGRD